jgi:hypothetical protein
MHPHDWQSIEPGSKVLLKPKHPLGPEIIGIVHERTYAWVRIRGLGQTQLDQATYELTVLEAKPKPVRKRVVTDYVDGEKVRESVSFPDECGDDFPFNDF